MAQAGAGAGHGSVEAAPAPVLVLDAGGTACRWAMAAADGQWLAQGEVAPFTASQAGADDGSMLLARVLAPLTRALSGHPAPGTLWLGLTGLDPRQAPLLARRLGPALGWPGVRALVFSDIELACRAHWAPGEGYVLYAGTGAIAGFIDAQDDWHRAGGRGVLIDDAGGGHWIARQALQQVWRQEDAQPGSWRQSAMACALLTRMGQPANKLAPHSASPDPWDTTRRWLANASRGQVGELALAVAEAAAIDPQAVALLHTAGTELARPALALCQRFGPRPLALAGRVWLLHPAVRRGLEAALPAGLTLRAMGEAVHLAAARRAALGQCRP